MSCYWRGYRPSHYRRNAGVSFELSSAHLQFALSYILNAILVAFLPSCLRANRVEATAHDRHYRTLRAPTRWQGGRRSERRRCRRLKGEWISHFVGLRVAVLGSAPPQTERQPACSKTALNALQLLSNQCYNSVVTSFGRGLKSHVSNCDEMRVYQRARRARLKAGTWPTAPKEAPPIAQRPAFARASPRTAIEGLAATLTISLPATPISGLPRGTAPVSRGTTFGGSTPAIGCSRFGPSRLRPRIPASARPIRRFTLRPMAGQRRSHARRPRRKRRARTAHRRA